MMTKQQYEIQLQEIKEMEDSWNREKDLIQRKQQIKCEKESFLKPRKKIATTKIIVAFILINCTVVEIYSMWVMYKLMDLSALYTLITAVIGESVTFAIYAVKSIRENTSGGIIYEQMKNSNLTPSNSSQESSSNGVG